MRIVIAGGTGFLGEPLARALAQDGCDVVILTRRASRGAAAATHWIEWNPDGTTGPWSSTLEGAYGLVNLAGESIAAKRWSPSQKQKIHDSRVLATRSLVAAIAQANPP